MHHLSTIAVRVRQSRWSFSILTGVCALAAIIISFLMGRNQSLWFDEQYSLLICSKPVRQMLALTAADAHPPLYYLLLKTWMTLVGGNVAMLRLLNCIFLGATVGIMALLVRSLYGRRVAVACLPLLLCGGFILRYGYELRMYSLAMLLVVFGTYALLRATGSIPAHTQSSTASDTTESLSHHHIHGWHAVYALTVALGMYTLYLTALVWITHVLWLFICSWKDSHESTVVSRLRKLSAFRWIPIYFVSIILYLPWIPSLFGQMGHPVLPPVRRSMNMTGLANAFDAILLGRTESSMPSMASLLALSIGIAVIVRLSIAKPHDRAFLLIATLFVVPLLMMTIWSAVRELVSNGYGFFSVRYLSFTAPFLYIALALLCLHSPAIRLRTSRLLYAVVLLTLFAGTMVFATQGNYNFDRADTPGTARLAQQVRCSKAHPVVAQDEYTYIDAYWYFRDCPAYYFLDDKDVPTRGGYAPLHDSAAQLHNINNLKTDNFTLLSWSKLHDTKYDALLKSKIWKRGTVTRVNGNASVLYRSKLID